MRPRLLCPELVTIQPVDRAGTRVDTLAAEPYAHQARGASIQLRAQVDELSRNRRQPGQGGASSPASVMLTFVATEVDAAGWTPSSGDRISRLADADGDNDRAVAWYVTEAHRLGKDGRRAKLIQVSAEARAPARTPVEGL